MLERQPIFSLLIPKLKMFRLSNPPVLASEKLHLSCKNQFNSKKNASSFHSLELPLPNIFIIDLKKFVNKFTIFGRTKKHIVVLFFKFIILTQKTIKLSTHSYNN